MKNYVLNILIAVDQFFTAVVGGFPDETLSSYAYRLELANKRGGIIFRPIIDFLFKWQGHTKGHCYQAYLEEVQRRQMPPSLR